MPGVRAGRRDRVIAPAADLATASAARRLAPGAAVDLLRAALDVKAVVGDRLTRPGGPATARAALTELRARADQLEQLLDGRLDHEVDEVASPRRPPNPQRISLTTDRTPRRR